MKNAISRHWTITCDVANTPNNLFNNFNMRGLQKLNKVLEHILLNQIIHMVSCARGDVGKAPSCFKLELWDVVVK